MAQEWLQLVESTLRTMQANTRIQAQVMLAAIHLPYATNYPSLTYYLFISPPLLLSHANAPPQLL